MRGFERRPPPSLTPPTRVLLGVLALLLSILNLLALHSHLVYDQANLDWRTLGSLTALLCLGFALWRIVKPTQAKNSFGETTSAMSLGYSLMTLAWMVGAGPKASSEAQATTDPTLMLIGGAITLALLLIVMAAVLINRDATNHSDIP